MAGTTLYCFHHAGGTEYQFVAWPRHLHPSVSVVGVPVEDRTALNQSIEDLAVNAFDFLLGADMATSAFYGHSMGGHVAFEVCRMLAKLGMELPAAVILGGSPPPGALHDALVVQQILASGGGDQTRLPDYVRQRTLEGIRRSCAYLPGCSDAPVQLDLIAGDRDSLVKGDEMWLWEAYCGPVPRYHRVDGGHLFHRTDVDKFMSVLRHLIPCNAHLMGIATVS